MFQPADEMKRFQILHFGNVGKIKGFLIVWKFLWVKYHSWFWSVFQIDPILGFWRIKTNLGDFDPRRQGFFWRKICVNFYFFEILWWLKIQFYQVFHIRDFQLLYKGQDSKMDFISSAEAKGSVKAVVLKSKFEYFNGGCRAKWPDKGPSIKDVSMS